MKNLHSIAVTILIILYVSLTSTVKAQGLSILRDAETEAFLREIGTPVFEAANLTPENVHLYLVGDKSINAFVTGGQNIFFHSGLIMRMDDVDQLLGVLAHETGHIAGGHSVRTQEAFSNAGNFSIASMVLGVAAILAGSPDAGMAAIMAGQQMTLGTMLSYSRTQEATTDQAGAKYLETIGVSGKGLISFFETLQEQELLYRASRNPYMRTHPLTSHRILRLESVVTSSPHYNKPPNPSWNNKFLRVRAKMEGYINGTAQTLRKYPTSKQTIPAKYARVYAYHKSLNWDAALKEVNELIQLEPDNPYFYEIKGQVLFESGQLNEALAPFKRAAELAPSEALILTAYAQALVTIEGKGGSVNKENMRKALPILKKATALDKTNSFAWFNLAKAYSGLEEKGLASLATAERYYSVGQMQQADFHAHIAQKEFDEGSYEWMRAQDIIIAARPVMEKLRKKRSSSRRRVAL